MRPEGLRFPTACSHAADLKNPKTVGETAARRKSANPAAPRLGGRGVSRKLWREPDGGKSEQHPEQEPKIGIQKEIFVRLHAAKGLRKKQEQSIPKNDETQRKPGRAL